MKICWDNLEKLRYNKKTNKWYKGTATYVYMDSCNECGEPFLTIYTNEGYFCSISCARKKNKHAEKHGERTDKSPTYISWCSMKQRCLNPKATGYHNYGGRGIIICERWMEFENFLSDMGERPEGMSLDRINNDGNYEPSNCKWSTPKEQFKNSRIKKVKGRFI